MQLRLYHSCLLHRYHWDRSSPHPRPRPRPRTHTRTLQPHTLQPRTL